MPTVTATTGDMFLDELSDALDGRNLGYSYAQVFRAIVRDLCKRYRLTIDTITPEMSSRIISAVKSGKCDEMK